MYAYILDPLCLKKFKINSKKGRNILKKYLLYVFGGSNHLKKKCYDEMGNKIKMRCPKNTYCNKDTKYCETKSNSPKKNYDIDNK